MVRSKGVDVVISSDDVTRRINAGHCRVGIRYNGHRDGIAGGARNADSSSLISRHVFNPFSANRMSYLRKRKNIFAGRIIPGDRDRRRSKGRTVGNGNDTVVDHDRRIALAIGGCSRETRYGGWIVRHELPRQNHRRSHGTANMPRKSRAFPVMARSNSLGPSK